MTNSRGLSRKSVLVAVLLVFGLVLFSGRASMGETPGEYPDDSTITAQINGTMVDDPDAHYFKIDVTTTRGYVLLQGFVNSRETEKRILEKIRAIRGVKSVENLLTVEEKK